MVAGRQPANPCTDLLDDPGSLVAADNGVPDGNVASPHVVIGVTQPGGDVAYQHLARPGRVKLQIDDLPVLVDSAQYRCPGFHIGLLPVRLPLTDISDSSL